MLNFTLFGVPVSVDPWFWAMAFFMGHGFEYIQRGEPMFVVVWMCVVFVSILVHELGHALVGHKLGGGRTWIKLWAFGGLAYHQAARFTPNSKRAMILAGPGAGFCLFVLTCVAMLVVWPGATGRELLTFAIGLWKPDTISQETIYAFNNEYMKYYIFKQLIWVNLWWSLVNLMPIYPLDGGQLLDTFIRSPKRLHLIGMIAAGLMIFIAVSVMQSNMLIVMMFGLFGFQNFKAYQEANY